VFRVADSKRYVACMYVLSGCYSAHRRSRTPQAGGGRGHKCLIFTIVISNVAHSRFLKAATANSFRHPSRIGTIYCVECTGHTFLESEFSCSSGVSVLLLHSDGCRFYVSCGHGVSHPQQPHVARWRILRTKFFKMSAYRTSHAARARL